MFRWKNAFLLLVVFAIVGIGYFIVQGDGQTVDRTGALLLVMLGAAMAFGLGVLLKASREL